MPFDRKFAIAGRIVREIRRDRRSLAMIIGAPIIVMSLIGFSFQDQKPVLNQAAPALIATMAMLFVFILTAISFLRERSQGTLERLLSTAVTRSFVKSTCPSKPSTASAWTWPAARFSTPIGSPSTRST